MTAQKQRLEFYQEEQSLLARLRGRDSEARRLVLRTTAIVLLTIAATVGVYVLVGHVDKKWAGPNGMVVVATVVFFLCSIALNRGSAKHAEDCIERLGVVSEEHLGDIKEIIDLRLRPRFDPLSTTEDLAAEGTRLMRTVRKDENRSKNPIVFVGSLGLGSRLDNDEGNENKASSRISPCSEYVAEQTLLTKGQVPQVRHICLMDPKAFAKRGQEYRRSYLSWTARQVQLLRDNPEYTLFHVPRAPRWAASTSWMFAGSAALQTVGDGVAGTLIVGDEIVGNIRAAIFEHMEDGHNRPEQYTSDKLEKYRKRLIKAANSHG